MLRSSSVSSTLAHAGADSQHSSYTPSGWDLRRECFAASSSTASVAGMGSVEGQYRRQRARNIARTADGVAYLRSPMSGVHRKRPPSGNGSTSSFERSAKLFGSSSSLANATDNRSSFLVPPQPPSAPETFMGSRYAGRLIQSESTNAVVALERDSDVRCCSASGRYDQRHNAPIVTSAPSSDDRSATGLSESNARLHGAVCDTSTPSSSLTGRPANTTEPSSSRPTSIWRPQQDDDGEKINRVRQTRWISGTVSFDSITSNMKRNIQHQHHEGGRPSGRTDQIGKAVTQLARVSQALSPQAERIGEAATAILARALSRDDDCLEESSQPSSVAGTSTHAYTHTLPSPHKSQPKFSTDILHRWDDCIYVRAEGGRTGSLIITSQHLIFEFDDHDGDYAESSFNVGFADEEVLCSDPENGFALASSSNSISELARPDIAFCDVLNSNGELEPEEVRLRRSRHRRTRSSACSSNSGTENAHSSSDLSAGSTCSYSSSHILTSTSRSTNDPTDTEHDVDASSCGDDTYQEEMDKAMIRAIEEEARRHLLELDEDDNETESRVESVAATSLYFSHQQEGYWATVQSSKQDKDQESEISGLDQDKMLAWRRQAENRKPGSGDIGGVNDFYPSEESDEELRWYTLGPDRVPEERKCRGIKWNLSLLGEIYARRFMMRDIAFEIFAQSPANTSLSPDDVPVGELSRSSFYIAVPALNATGHRQHQTARRDDVVQKLRDCATHLNFSYWREDIHGRGVHEGRWNPASIIKRRVASRSLSGADRREKVADALHLLTKTWKKGNMSNFDYLSRLNAIAGRSHHDPSSYPVFPWVLSNFSSKTVPDLSDEKNFRDLSKAMGALDAERLDKFLGKYTSLCSASTADSAIPPFMYGSHYSSTGGVPLYYLCRKRPFAGLHRQLHEGAFDVADRLFRSVLMTYDLCSKTSPEVKELTPEWYSDTSFLRNRHCFDLGTCVNGEKVGDVILPPWATGNPEKFIEVMRNALESDICSQKLPLWIDLIFGIKQKGPEARKAHNVFYHLTYYEADDLAKIEDDELRTEIELHISDFGHCPQQLFTHRPHPCKKITDSVRKAELSELGRIRMIASTSAVESTR